MPLTYSRAVPIMPFLGRVIVCLIVWGGGGGGGFVFLFLIYILFGKVSE